MLDQPDYRAEVSRKVLHLSSAAIAVTYCFVDRGPMLGLLLACFLVAVATEVLRQCHAGFGRLFRRSVGFMLRRTEWDRITGATYVLLGALLSVALFPRPVAVGVLLMLSISDSVASLVGLRFGRGRFLGKSLAGSLAFFLSALAIAWTVWPEAGGPGFASALIATVAEALPALRLGRFELNDNVTIPLLAGAAICLLHPPLAAAA